MIIMFKIRKLHNLCSNTVLNYILFIIFMTISANWIFSLSLTTLEKGTKYATSKEESAAEIRFKLPNDSKKIEGHITVYPFKGGLGNHMFQLASLIGIARKNNLTLSLCSQMFLPDTVFDIPTFIHRENNLDLDMYNNYIDTAHAKYNDIQLDGRKNWILEGYFQSYRYFSEYDKDIRKVFDFKEEFSEEVERFLRERVPVNTLMVGIQVRRGDFISSYQQKLGRVAPDMGYITKAMAIFQRWYKNITFIVISDDKEWCRNNIKAPNVIYSPFHHAGADLALARQCDHMIITVGTFGWWAGWLLAGRVIYYADYPRAGSQIDSEFAKEDYYPEQWIPLAGLQGET